MKVLEDCHFSSIGGHFGFHKPCYDIRQSFVGPNLHFMVKQFVWQWTICQKYKTNCLKHGGLLQPLPVPTRMWCDVLMDFIEGLSPSNWHTSIMVVVDRLSKYGYFVALKHPFMATTIAKIFISNLVLLYDIPTINVSNLDTVFISFFRKTLLQLYSTKLCMS